MLTFVNYLGQAVSTAPVAKPKSKTVDLDPYHKGWRVVGVPPGAVEEAEQEHKKKSQKARAAGKAILDFNPLEWLQKAKRKSVRSKPYSIHEAAATCAELAEKAGWERVEVLEVSKGGGAR